MSWQIDPTHSSISFSAKHMMFTTVRGHFGGFEGQLDLDFAHPEASVISGKVDVASLTTGEENRDAHLRSADFFDVGTYPAITFRSTRIERAGRDAYKLHGELTIRETTRPFVWNVQYEGQGKDPWGNLRHAFSATAALSRKDFGMTWNVALETGGWLVSDTINIAAELQVVLVPESDPKPEVALA